MEEKISQPLVRVDLCTLLPAHSGLGTNILLRIELDTIVYNYRFQFPAQKYVELLNCEELHFYD